MRREIRALQRRLGITMVYVTHDQVEAMTMADQVILMRAGRIEQNGAPADLYQRPETMFVARFVGAPAMNVFPGVLLAGQRDLTAGIPADHELTTLCVGVRPECVRLAEKGLPVRVVAAEYLGADTQVETHTGGETMPETIMLRTPGRLAAAPGETVHLRWDPGDTHWFHASSQRRIG
jgi:sn-glycerol 3-phosphate transport system ATP-binding protein